MSNVLHNALLFLITTLIDLYAFILVVRIVMVWVGSNYYNPMMQFVIKLTEGAIRPLRKIIPNYQRAELASIFLLLLLECVKYLLVGLIDNFGVPHIGGLCLLAIADTLKLIIQLFFYAILLQAILSWVQPTSPLIASLYQFTAPILRPLQRLLPSVGGLDLSALAALILLQLISIVLISPLLVIGARIAFG